MQIGVIVKELYYADVMARTHFLIICPLLGESTKQPFDISFVISLNKPEYTANCKWFEMPWQSRDAGVISFHTLGKEQVRWLHLLLNDPIPPMSPSHEGSNIDMVSLINAN